MRKILWSHTRGDINIGDSTVAIGTMPCILPWVGDVLNTGNDNLLCYRKHPNPSASFGDTGHDDPISLNLFYHILWSRPSILHNGCSKKQEDAKRKADEMMDFRSKNKGLCDEIEDLRNKNKRLKAMLQTKNSS